MGDCTVIIASRCYRRDEALIIAQESESMAYLAVSEVLFHIYHIITAHRISRFRKSKFRRKGRERQFQSLSIEAFDVVILYFRIIYRARENMIVI